MKTIVCLTHPMMKRMSRALRIWGLTVFGTVAVDQLTKALALYFEPCRLAIIPNFFSLTLTTNPGSIWGLGAEYTRFFAYLGIVFLVLAVFFFCSFLKTRPIVGGFLTGGILGNTLDRFRYGCVTDFLDFYVKEWHWPCFNVADIAITGTCLWLMFGGGMKKNG